MPLDEFDHGDDGIIHPRPLVVDGVFPPAAVLCFFPEAIQAALNSGTLLKIGLFSEQVGGASIFATLDRRTAVFHPGMGGPLVAHCLEQAIASGVTRVIAIGGAGTLNSSFGKNEVLVVGSAIRDEGTSFHYLEPSRKVDFDGTERERIAQGLRDLGIPVRTGVTWTTDADFRETPARVERRREEGAIAVEMEAASLAAVCQFRGVTYAHVLYSGDSLQNETWSGRSWTTSHRRGQLLEAALLLSAR